MKTAIYPGTFDPITNGHLDILQRACNIFDKVIMAVAHNPDKHPMFNVEERMALINGNIEVGQNAEVRHFHGLLVDFAKEVDAIAIIRGLRAVSDFEFEFQMTQMNRDLDPEIETIFFMPSQDYFFTSSSLVKQVAMFSRERIDKFVPLNVAAALDKRFKNNTADFGQDDVVK